MVDKSSLQLQGNSQQDNRRAWERQKVLNEIARLTLLEEQRNATLLCSCTELYQNCYNIHASFFFQPSWSNVLSTLCHKLCNRTSTSSGGWMDFAAHLSLDKDLIDSVKHGNFNIPMSYADIVLKEFAKDDDATVDKIFKALEKMKRYDIIDTLFPFIIENSSRAVIFPVKCKEIMCRNSCKSVAKNETQSLTFNLAIDEGLQNFEDTFFVHQTKESENEPKKMHSKTVMLTFAEDGEAVAKDLASALRTSFDKHHRSIGVVILSENRYLIAEDPCMKITRCFNQVDFVIPIITRKYIDRVYPSTLESTDSMTPSPCVQPDEYYAPLIFRLMSTEYTRQHCLNTRFRSVISSDHKDILFSNQPIMNIPFLSPWSLSTYAIQVPRKALLLRKTGRSIQKITR